MKENIVAAVDPGRQKCGLAVVHREQGILYRSVVETENLPEQLMTVVQRYRPDRILLGDGTGQAPVAAALQKNLDGVTGQPLLPITSVDEYGTTEQARQRYWREQPPRGWRRLLPQGLLMPPVPVDDYVAVLLAERYFAVGASKNKKK
ncbi:MAG TPA: pre-16S rRNA-processing nuclease YqgF [Patescibacteria group bacterium]|nr:pre-16S rRNA-processing nuclease YqgF [Patescibacteria group bacterium]